MEGDTIFKCIVTFSTHEPLYVVQAWVKTITMTSRKYVVVRQGFVLLTFWTISPLTRFPRNANVWMFFRTDTHSSLQSKERQRELPRMRMHPGEKSLYDLSPKHTKEKDRGHRSFIILISFASSFARKQFLSLFLICTQYQRTAMCTGRKVCITKRILFP